MLKKLLYGLAAIVTVYTANILYCYANDIYIEQVGDNLDLDIVQDGQNNVIGTSTQSVLLGGTTSAADDMTFDITQTGDSNTISAQIQGNNYTGTWSFTGDSNTVALMCDSAAAGNCETVTLNIAGTGDSQQYTINIGESADADSATVNFTVDDDSTVTTLDIDGTSAAVTVNVFWSTDMLHNLN